MKQLTFWLEAPPANPSQSQACEKDWTIRVATSCSPTELLQNVISRGGSFGRMSPVSCPPTKAGILEPSSGCWRNSGMGSPTEFLTLSGSEWPKDAAVCSLSDILETGDVPQRYYLSPKACAGILRRAAKRGKKLPPLLADALKAVATGMKE